MAVRRTTEQKRFPSLAREGIVRVGFKFANLNKRAAESQQRLEALGDALDESLGEQADGEISIREQGAR